jgi:polyhydroxyalkanoate synthase
MTAPGAAPAGIVIETRVREEVERALLRNVKGLEYLSAGGPEMGLTPKDVVYARGT